MKRGDTKAGMKANIRYFIKWSALALVIATRVTFVTEKRFFSSAFISSVGNTSKKGFSMLSLTSRRSSEEALHGAQTEALLPALCGQPLLF